MTEPGANRQDVAEPPLVVDLDGTLLLSDVLHESTLRLARNHPLHLLALPFRLRAGKAPLKQFVADRVELQVRASDVAARYGGEEFALLLPDTRAEDALTLAERIRLSVSSEPFRLEEGLELEVTVSIGVSAISPGRGIEDLKSLGEQLIAEADVQLYRAKSDGRNRVRWDAA